MSNYPDTVKESDFDEPHTDECKECGVEAQLDSDLLCDECIKDKMEIIEKLEELENE